VKRIACFIILISMTLVSFSGCKKDFLESFKDVEESTKKSTQENVTKTAVYSYKTPILKKSLLKMDEVFLLGNDLTVISEGIYYNQYFDNLYIISGKGELIKQFQNVELLGQPGILNVNKNLYMGTYTNEGYLYGLYDFKKLDWSIKPQYSNMIPISENFYKVIDQDENSGVINSEGKVIIPFKYPSNYSFRMAEDYFICSSYEENQVLILEEGGKVITIIEGCDAEAIGNNLLVYHIDGNNSLYDLQGKPVFDNLSQEYFFDSYYKKIVEHEGNHYRIYNEDLRMLCELQLKEGQELYTQENFFTVNIENNGAYIQEYYDYDGNLLTDESGKPFTHVYSSYLYSRQNTTTNILDTKTMKHITLQESITDDMSIVEIGKGFFGITNYTNDYYRMNIYNDQGEKLPSKEFEWAYTFGDYIVGTSEPEYIYDYNFICTIIDFKGKVLYESSDRENISPVSDSILFAKRGNFIGIIDMDGKWIFKTFLANE